MLGVNPRFDFIASVPADVADPDAPGRVHLVAIGGAGMSAVARLLLERGVAAEAATGVQLQGKELSFNNLLDLEASRAIARARPSTPAFAAL